MVSEFKVEVIQEETIKPSSPTPHHLKTVNLSVFDQLSPGVYVPLLLFYPNNISARGDGANNFDKYQFLVAERSKLLKKSLSQALSRFYPFAGKFQYNDSICCNDHGAKFFEAQVSCPISKILDKPNLVMLKQLIPTDTESTQAGTCYLLLVQANFFECGGMVIGVSLSHKVADASTLSTFIKSWAAVALCSASTTDHALLPAEFGTPASLFPALDFLNTPQPAVEFTQEKCITRRFVFDASKIAALKSEASSATVPNPTRVQVVSALIWRCAMLASSNLVCVRPSEWFHLVNMRRILVQPSAENFLGNLVGLFAAKTEASEAVDDVQMLVAKLRKVIQEFKAKYVNCVSEDEACEFFKEYWNLMIRDDVETYSCSSWCRLPFYEANFGWGKPSWVSQLMEFKNLIVFMDTRDGNGIEVSLTLKEEDMAFFESNKELLEYASLNPSAI